MNEETPDEQAQIEAAIRKARCEFCGIDTGLRLYAPLRRRRSVICYFCQEVDLQVRDIEDFWIYRYQLARRYLK